jgi:hypothetical protein
MNWPALAAQCVMCFRTAAAQQAERSRVLNSGIVILLIPPIVVLAGILLLAFRKNRREPPVELLLAPHDTPHPDLD